MSTEIATVEEPKNELAPVVENYLAEGMDEKALGELSGSGFGQYLPRLQLCGASSNLCKEGKIPIARYAFVKSKDNFTDIGVAVNVRLYGLRVKAMKFMPDTILSYFDHTKEEFKAIQAVSLERDSGCLAGPEYLVWIPQYGWCTLFLTSKSARNESPNIRPFLGKAATFTIHLAENKKKDKWHVIRSGPCSVPIGEPDADEVQAMRHKFSNPVDSKETAVPGEQSSREM